MARGPYRGAFMHEAPGQSPVPVGQPAKSTLSLDDRSVVLKIHGAAHRVDEALDSFVVTEDDYIDYMANTDLVSAVPAKLLTTMLESHFLFLGYSLADWNLRVFLHGLWARRSKTAANWAVNHVHSELDELFWAKRSVDMIQAPLADYAAALETALGNL